MGINEVNGNIIMVGDIKLVAVHVPEFGLEIKIVNVISNNSIEQEALKAYLKQAMIHGIRIECVAGGCGSDMDTYNEYRIKVNFPK